MMTTALERSKRSILVGNIPSDTTEEQFRVLLREFGSIVDFRFFNDSSGNQIGFAFCEYENPDMAVKAIHQLNDFQYRGQILKVDTAASDKSKEELGSFLQGSGNNARMEHPDFDSRGEKAPEEISKAVASLPPEQMFELMKQMKMCIENNPHEARNLLLQNPQLAYALLQAQVIMRIVDPEVAIKILDRPVTAPPPMSAIPTSEASASPESVPSVPSMENNSSIFPPGFPVGSDQDMRQQFRDSDMRNLSNTEIGRHLFDPRYRSGSDPRMLQAPNVRMQDPRMMSELDSRGMPNIDPRGAPGPDPRVSSNPDPRRMPMPDPRGMPIPDPRGMPVADPRGMPIADPRGMPVADPRGIPVPDLRGMPVTDPRGMPVPDPRGMPVPDPRGMPVPDPRGMSVTDPRGIPVTDPRGMPLADPRVPPFGDPRGISGSDLRGMMGPDPRTLTSIDPRMDPRSTNPSDPRATRAQDPRITQLPDARLMSMGNSDPRMAQGGDPRLIANLNKGNMEVRTASNMDPRVMPPTDSRVDPRIAPLTDPRARPGSDPRLKPGFHEDSLKPPTSEGAPASASHLLAGAGVPIPPSSSAPSGIGVPPARSSDVLSSLSSGSLRPDQEKAALIMQVLQLSDEQIAVLPPEQRQSILLLKEQVARSHLT